MCFPLKFTNYVLVDSIFSTYPVNQTGFVGQTVEFHCTTPRHNPMGRYFVFFVSYDIHGKFFTLDDYDNLDDWTRAIASLMLTEASNGTNLSCIAATYDNSVIIQGPPVYTFCQGMHVACYYYSSVISFCFRDTSSNWLASHCRI